MSINQEGFLSKEISEWIAKHHADNAEWFGLTDELNRLGQQLMLSAKPPQDDAQRVLAAFYFVRVLSGFQGTVVLAERGMTTEAQTLARACLETLFCFSAIVEDQDFFKHLIEADTHHKITIASKLTELPDGLQGFTPERSAQLLNFLKSKKDSGDTGTKLDLFSAASKGGLSEIYNTVYRHLSNKAAHPSLASLERYLGDGPSDVAIRWGPAVNDIAETLNAACMSLIAAQKLQCKIFQIAAYESEIDEIWTRYQALMEEQLKQTEIKMDEAATQ